MVSKIVFDRTVLNVTKRTIIFCIILFSLLFSCKNEELTLSRNPEVIENKIFNSSEFNSRFHSDSLTIEEGLVKIKPGQLQVFQRTYSFPDDKRVADDEYTDYIYFQRLADSKDLFILKDQEINQNNFFYYRRCFCLPMINQKVSKGTITGIRFSDAWQVSTNVDLMMYHGYNNVIRDSFLTNINFNAAFRE